MTLAPNSDLIDAGTTIGWNEFADYPGIGAINYYGSSPDIGFSEYNPDIPSAYKNPVKNIISQVKIYPNPAREIINIIFAIADADFAHYHLKSMSIIHRYSHLCSAV